MKEASVEEQLCGFLDDLEESLHYDSGKTFDCDNILLCGVGGSAVSGDFASDCCFTESVKPIRLMKYPDVPNWVGPRTLAIVSSYSGNTAETVEMYRQVTERGCTVVVITSGGMLGDLASANGDHIMTLPKGMQPRHAIGFMIGYTLETIRMAGGPDLRDRITGLMPSLRQYRQAISEGDGCLAKEIAGFLMGSVPVICSDASMRSVAFRWKTQINENSKFVAFCDYAPLFNEHSLDSWARTDRSNYALLVLIGCNDGMSDGTPYLEDIVSRMEGSSAKCRAVRLGGSSTLENMFRAIILGDYVSINMARMRGIDPAEVRPVMQLKAKLAQRNRSLQAF